MAIGMIVTIPTKPGKAEAFEAAFAIQAEKVRKSEPGNKLYQLFKPADKPGVYVVVEIYDDADAIKAHMEAPHMVENRAAMSELIDRPAATVERFEAL